MKNFKKAYLSTDVALRKKYELGKTTKLLVCTLETFDDKILRDLFISYGKEYLNLFLESLYPIIKNSLNGRVEFYIQCMGRAFYKVNRNSWSIVTDKTKPQMLRFALRTGFCIECVLEDDESTFDLVTEKQPDSMLIYEVAMASAEARTTKYLIKIIEYIAQYELEADQEKTDSYLQAIDNVGGDDVNALAWTIRAIKDHSKWSLQDILRFILQDRDYRAYAVRNIYQALYLTGLPIQEIQSIVESNPDYAYIDSYMDWKASMKEENV